MKNLKIQVFWAHRPKMVCHVGAREEPRAKKKKVMAGTRTVAVCPGQSVSSSWIVSGTERERPATGEKKSATPRAVRGQKPSHASLPVPLTNTSRGTTLCANRASQRLSTRMAEQESIWGVTRRVLDFLIGKDRIGHRRWVASCSLVCVNLPYRLIRLFHSPY